MDQTRALAGFLLVTIALTGCTGLPSTGNGDDTGSSGQVSASQNDGFDIRFSSATAEYYTDQGSATFTVNIENTGEAEDGTLSSLKLFGASWATSASTQNPGTTLQGVEEANNLAGGTYSTTFTPSLPTALQQGQSDDYTVGLRTRYTYTTRSRSELTVQSSDRYREEGRNARQGMRNTVRGAPVQVRFTGQTPVPYRSGSVNVPVTVRNVGDGQLAGNKLTSLKVGPEGNLQNCPSSQGSGVPLYEGSRQFSCSISVSQPSPETTVTLVAEAKYDYVEDDTTTVTVVGAN